MKESFRTTVDTTVGLIKMISTAVGPNNLKNINTSITSGRFKLEEGVREADLEVVSFQASETGEQAAARLVSDGYTIEGIGELASFLTSHPEEVEKFGWVVVLSEPSRWAFAGDGVLVPCACVRGSGRGFGLVSFRSRFRSVNGVLVSRCSK